MSDQLLAKAVQALLLRDVRGLQRELREYPDEETVWRIVPGVSNSAGTLALHVAGNLQHFVGAVLGESGYVRDRDAEFSRRDVPREELERELDAAARSVESVLPNLTRDGLERPYPVPIAGRRVRTADFLVHLVAHVGYHLGQVDYHRRVLTGGGSAGAVSPSDLPEVAE